MFGHPNKEVIDRIEKYIKNKNSKGKLYRTDILRWNNIRFR